MKFPVFSAYIICLLLTASSINVRAQTTTLTTLQNTLETLANNFPQEKIYIQFDKPSYAPGETVWFKTYIMAGADPSAISKAVYVDFVTAEGRTIKHCVIPVLQAGGAGDYEVPLDFKNDYVYVKAYTKWMLNFDSSFLYRKTLHIIQPKPVVRKQAVPAQKTAIQFLPEGGNIVEGIETVVAFKALHFDGKPAPVSGAVFNNSNAKVADIKTMHDGMGKFLLTAKSGETYTAKWKDDMGNSYETKLPAAEANGVVLKITVQPTVRSFTIQRSADAPANLQKLYVIATMQQHLVYGAGVNLSQVPATGGAIPISELPSGVLQITVFDSNWVAVAERISFVNNDNYSFEPEVGFSQLGTDKRKQNTLVIHTDTSITANLSVSVTDVGMGIDSTDDIISKLLLTADLKGNVYHPYYYFKNKEDSLQQQLDLVMLTNGWRRINWTDVVSNKFQKLKYENEADYFSLSGKVYGATEQQLKKGAIILMILKNNLDTASRVMQTLIDEKGEFSNPNIILYDTSKVYYRISGTDNFANSSVINFNTSQTAPKIIAADTAANAFFADTATENYKQRLAALQVRNFKMQQGTTLQDVVVKTRAKSPTQVLDEKYASPLFSGDAYQFDVVNDPFAKSAISVLQYLQGKVAGLSITTSGSPGGNSSVSWRGSTPTFFMNEMQMDINSISTISMSDVAYIKVLRPPFIGAPGGGSGGAIAIYTRKGGDIESRPDAGKGIPYKMIIGYTAQKEFYSPDYGSINQRNEEQDIRTTLYWAPTILTNASNSTIKLRFYNNDFSQGFRVVVEGITTDGKLTRIEKVIE